MTTKPLLCLDFDGVIHSYTSGWKGHDQIPDLPVPGALDFISRATEHFAVAIYSSRSGQPGGIAAMQKWLESHLFLADYRLNLMKLIQWPETKPPAMITLDDRAITFTGEWPDLASLLSFKPWNK